MKHAARLIIPVWGEQYVSRALAVMLPAVMAPGNLPALCAMFEVELVIVTESRLFDSIKTSQSFRKAAELCGVRLAPLDDVITGVHRDYGMVLTYALFRGFADLGPRATETYLLFLNADFIISDGSLRHLGKLMREGRRLIHAPSFRVSFEDVWPHLQKHVDAHSGALSLTSRQMVKLALANKHPTVKARTVNQRLCHLSWMDQYYWYVDEDTMISYQSPVALIAVKPERVVTEPTGFWDYGFVPEAAPTTVPTFIHDSDDFFMIESQGRDTGREMLRIGWLSLDDLARTESLRATKEHRVSSRQLLIAHAGDLPADLHDFTDESRAYMAEITRRLSPTPAPHIGHPVLGQWFEETKQRQRGTNGSARQDYQNLTGGSAPSGSHSETPSRGKMMLRTLRSLYRRTLGSPPQVGKFHPLWIDASPIRRKIAIWRQDGRQNILWLSSSASMFEPLLGNRLDPASLTAPYIRATINKKAPYDACLCQPTVLELEQLDRLYTAIRPLMKENAQIVVSVTKNKNVFESAEYFLEHINYPDVDVSEIHFYGTAATGLLRALYARAARLCSERPVMRGLIMGAVLLMLAPLIRLANAHAARRDTTIFLPTWTSLLIEFTVKRGRPLQSEQPSSQADLAIERSP